MKSDIDFAANNAGDIVITQTTIMSPREFLTYAQQVYVFASNMTRGVHESKLIEAKTVPVDG